MIILDTSALLRFFTNDEVNKAAKTRELLDSNHDLFLAESVALEIVFTLRKSYGISKEKILEGLKFLLSKKNIKADEFLPPATELFSKLNISLADCLLLAKAEKFEARVATFDIDLGKALKGRKYW